MAPRLTLSERLNLKTDLIKVVSPNWSGRFIAPTFLTIHNTANSDRGANALNAALYLKGANARTPASTLRFAKTRALTSWHLIRELSLLTDALLRRLDAFRNNTKWLQRVRQELSPGSPPP